MKMTKGRRSALRKVLAFTDDGFEPTVKGIELFFKRSENGETPTYEDTDDYKSYAQLLLGHHMLSGAQIAIWGEGHATGDFPLGVLLQNYEHLEISNPVLFERKRPAYEMAKVFHDWINNS